MRYLSAALRSLSLSGMEELWDCSRLSGQFAIRCATWTRTAAPQGGYVLDAMVLYRPALRSNRDDRHSVLCPDNCSRSRLEKEVKFGVVDHDCGEVGERGVTCKEIGC